MKNVKHFFKLSIITMGLYLLFVASSCNQDCDLEQAPQNLTATTNGEDLPTQLNVSWDAVSGAADYRLIVKDSSGFVIKDTITPNTAVNAIPISPLLQGPVYDTEVIPRCENGEESPNSSTLRVVVPIIIDIVIQSMPTGNLGINDPCINTPVTPGIVGNSFTFKENYPSISPTKRVIHTHKATVSSALVEFKLVFDDEYRGLGFIPLTTGLTIGGQGNQIFYNGLLVISMDNVQYPNTGTERVEYTLRLGGAVTSHAVTLCNKY